MGNKKLRKAYSILVKKSNARLEERKKLIEVKKETRERTS
jgi:hypothetical protein